MTTISIPQQLFREKEAILIPRSEYEELLAFKKAFAVVEPSPAERRAITRGRKEVKEKKYRVWK